MTDYLDLIGTGWRYPIDVDGRGGVALVSGDEEIRQAIEIILNTPRGARLMRPEFGCRIHELIFAPINTSTATDAVYYVEDALRRWEPRIELLGVTVDRDPDEPTCLLIAINYRIRATHDERALVYPFYTIPEE